MAAIVEALVQLLANTQRPEEAPRKKAEADLKQAQTNPDYPKALAAIASGPYPTQIRQSALTVLRSFIDHNWSEDVDEDEDDGPRIPIDDATKVELRNQLLELATRDEDDRRVKASVRYAGQPPNSHPRSCYGLLNGSVMSWARLPASTTPNAGPNSSIVSWP